VTVILAQPARFSGPTKKSHNSVVDTQQFLDKP
jgi:hypothetical protein